MNKLKVFILAIYFVGCFSLQAKEGMWLPFMVEQLNYQDLQVSGFKLSAEDIYSVNKACLKDAIVLFGSGCTGAVVSDRGLIITNHHCGAWHISKNSTVDKNYLENGFWALNKYEELPNPGLTVKFLFKIVDFTSQVTADIPAHLNYTEQQGIIADRIVSLESAIEDSCEYKASIESFWSGDTYYLFLYNEYRDIRLVGAPPESIASFGGDVDNWVWPRHSADFSIFRIYSSADGKPADYSVNNIPLSVKKKFVISAKGIKENDFTMILGFPGSTQENIYSGELEFNFTTLYPHRIKLRDGRLEIINKARAADKKIYLQYASKQSQISNSWKKWKGVQYGFEKFNVIEKRKEYENWLVENAGNRKTELTEMYDMLDESFNNYKLYNNTVDFLNESVFVIEPFSLSRKLALILEASQACNVNPEKVNRDLTALKNSYFATYYMEIDKSLTQFFLKNYMADVDELYFPPSLLNLKGNDFEKYIEKLYTTSVLTDSVKFSKAIKEAANGNPKSFLKDPIYKLYNEFRAMYNNELSANYAYYKNQYQNLYREYYKLIRSIDTSKVFYPDANLTMRISYGKVSSYSPSDGVQYHFQTFSDGLIQKLSQGISDYQAPERLIELFTERNFDGYSDSLGRLPLCFIASNHTSGGNSGSPVIDGEGRLIGLNFDRTWESTMSDFYFDEKICRNVSIDIRYVLFIIDKYAGAGYLLNEMELIR